MAEDPDGGNQRSWHHADEQEARPPRSGKVLREIGLVIAAHVALISIIVLSLRWCGIR